MSKTVSKKDAYKKEWYVGTSIAKGFIGTSAGSRIPTISSYAETFDCSRGIIQNAISLLESEGAVVLEKQGKMGSFLVKKDNKKLFAASGLRHLTASMPPPFNRHFAGLATGICQGMNGCEVPFTFAFVHGSRNRVEALLSGSYDFIVTTKYAADKCIAKNERLEIAFPFEGSFYSQPYSLYINKPGKKGIEDGMCVGVDFASEDQADITEKLCKGRKVKLLEMPVMSMNNAFFSGEIDCMVFRSSIMQDGETLLNFIMKHEFPVAPEDVSEIAIDGLISSDMQLPVALVCSDNYGMSGILKEYLQGSLVGEIQKKVLEGVIAPQFY